MPNLPHSIELHDSRVASAVVHGGALVISFEPAYVHRDGKGWNQNARLVLSNATVEPLEIDLPAILDDGEMDTCLGPYHNLLTLPLRSPGPASLTFEFMSGAVLRATGDGVELTLIGDPIFVEDCNR